MRAIPFGIAVVGLVVVGMANVKWHNEMQVQAKQLAALSAVVDEVRRSLTDDEHTRPPPTQMLREIHYVNDGPERTPPKAAAAASDAGIREPAQIIAELDGRFFSEDIDNSWARDATVNLTDASRRIASQGAKIDSVECRSTMCRVEGTFPSAKSFNDWFDKLFVGPDALVQHGGVLVPPPTPGDEIDGDQAKQVFVARAGADVRF